MLPAGHRLRASADFSAAVRGANGQAGNGRAGAVGASRGVRVGSTLLVLHLNATDARSGLPARVGFVVSKALGGAVVRNRTKRRLRALMAARLDRLPAGTDVVVRANSVAAQADSRELGAELDGVLSRGLARLAQRSQASSLTEARS